MFRHEKMPCDGCEQLAHRVSTRNSVSLCWDCWERKNDIMEDARRGSQGLKKRLIKETGGTCSQCGNRFTFKELVLHHIHPISLGGQTTRGNVELLCKDCHRAHHSKAPLRDIAHKLLK